MYKDFEQKIREIGNIEHIEKEIGVTLKAIYSHFCEFSQN